VLVVLLVKQMEEPLTAVMGAIQSLDQLRQLAVVAVAVINGLELAHGVVDLVVLAVDYHKALAHLRRLEQRIKAMLVVPMKTQHRQMVLVLEAVAQEPLGKMLIMVLAVMAVLVSHLQFQGQV